MILSLTQHGAVGETGVCRLVYANEWQGAGPSADLGTRGRAYHAL
ncbi:MAG: hypothetical protein ABJL72_10060 [Roseobacter sp.]